MTPEEHRARHKELHASFDELLADFLDHNRNEHLTGLTIMRFLEWSYQQTLEPTPGHGDDQ